MAIEEATREELLAALKLSKNVLGRCEYCGTLFVGDRRRRTCSQAHRVALYYRHLRARSRQLAELEAQK